MIEIYNKRPDHDQGLRQKSAGIETRVWVASPNLSNDYLVGLLSGRTIMSVGNNTKCQQMMKKSGIGTESTAKCVPG